MGRIPVQALVSAFEEIIGWPYESPGSNNASGIDCSGAFVRAFRLRGASIYHGSNTIFRRHCSRTGRIAGAGSLVPGMALFKRREDGGEPAQYRGDGIGNVYHIGLVTSVSPLRIVHATPPRAKADTALGNWWFWGLLKDVEYGGDEGMQRQTAARGLVVSADGNPVKLRPGPDTTKPYLAKVPAGVMVEVLEVGSEWCTVLALGKRGYMMRRFLALEGEGEDGRADGVAGGDGGEAGGAGVSREEYEALLARVEDLEAWRMALEGGGEG